MPLVQVLPTSPSKGRSPNSQYDLTDGAKPTPHIRRRSRPATRLARFWVSPPASCPCLLPPAPASCLLLLPPVRSRQFSDPFQLDEAIARLPTGASFFQTSADSEKVAPGTSAFFRSGREKSICEALSD